MPFIVMLSPVASIAGAGIHVFSKVDQCMKRLAIRLFSEDFSEFVWCSALAFKVNAYQ